MKKLALPLYITKYPLLGIVCASIVNSVAPLLLRQYRETDIATSRKTIMDVILEFFEASTALYGSMDGDVDSKVNGRESKL